MRNCPDCGMGFSDEVTNCPDCGSNLASDLAATPVSSMPLARTPKSFGFRDMLISVLFPWFGVGIGVFAFFRGEKQRGSRIICISIAVIMVVILTLRLRP